MIGVKPEIVKRTITDRIRVLIGCKRFRAPGYGGRVGGINIPWRAAISETIKCAVIWEGRVLRWRMKLDVSDINPGSDRHGEGLNPAVEVLVIKCVLIVPHATTQVRHFVTHEPDSISEVGRFDLVYRRAGPGLNGWLFSHGRTSSGKIEIRRAATDGVLTVRSVVVHVALVGMSLAPGALMWDDVFRFGKIGSVRILRRDQITGIYQNPVRCYVMTVAAVIVRCITRRETSGERIDPGTRTDPTLVAV